MYQILETNLPKKKKGLGEVSLCFLKQFPHYYLCHGIQMTILKLKSQDLICFLLSVAL